MRSKLTATSLLLLVLLSTPPRAAQTDTAGDAPAFARAALAKQKGRAFWLQPNSVLLRYVDFVYEASVTKATLDGKGLVKEHASWKQEVLPIMGATFFVLLEENGVPVDPRKRSEEERNNQKRLEDLQREPEPQRARNQAAFQERRAERWTFWDEFGRAFRFAFLERGDHNGRPTTRVSFAPDPSYRPRGIIDTEYLPKIAGQPWIDEQETEIARLQLRFEQDHKIGLGTLGSINRGTAYSMELAKQVQGLWLPKQAETEWHVRKLVVTSHERFTVDFGNYRRLMVDSAFTVK